MAGREGGTALEKSCGFPISDLSLNSTQAGHPPLDIHPKARIISEGNVTPRG